jgi:putative nucleotidyltransferase with HDIG domain
VGSFLALVLALGAPSIFGHKLKQGDVADRDFTAERSMRVVDLLATERAREQARSKTVPIFKRDDATNQRILAKVKQTLDSTSAMPAVGAPPTSLQAAISKVGAAQWNQQSQSSTQRFLSCEDLLAGHQKQWPAQVMEFLPESWSANLRDQTAALLATDLEPNVIVDSDATEQAVKEAMAHTNPVTRDIEAGSLIVPKGEILTSEDINILDQMGINYVRDFKKVGGLVLSLLAAFGLIAIYLWRFEPEFLASPSAIALMATVCVVTSGIASAVGREYPQFVPLPAAALVLSVIYGKRTAMVLAVMLLLFLGVSDHLDASHLVALGAASAVAFGTNISRRTELMFTGVLIGIIQAIAYFFVAVFGGKAGSAMGVGEELAENLLGGLSSSIVAIGSLPFLETLFGILTPFRIAELSEPDQPLLRQLEENAPGTYQHSLAVANLAEAGAKAINANVNLVRAGAMYHDIGKMVTPKYFIENQLGGKNPHDEIAPEDSRARVLAHVTNGLDLAEKYGLPRQIQAFIPEHQGTTIMAYFYHKACVRDGFANVRESDYRYPGPKPQTKETAIVMLADVSEAVTHSMHDPTQEEVDAAIGNVFKARWDDGQFSESTLTEAELKRVQEGFARVWRTLHHERLKYPTTSTGRMPVPPTYIESQAQGGNGQGQSQPTEEPKVTGESFQSDC